MSRLVALTIFLPMAIAYVFDCLDSCECDTEDEVVHCHNGQRTTLQLPTGQRLRGFPVIGLTYNKIITLPDQKTLLAKFPDLKVIDVERNPDFECNSLSKYDIIKIISDCDKNISEISRVPRIFRPTKDCDFACQAQQHYNKLHEYVLRLWDILREKYHNFDYDATLQKVETFFTEVARKINKLGKNTYTNINNELTRQSNSTESMFDHQEVKIPT